MFFLILSSLLSDMSMCSLSRQKCQLVLNFEMKYSMFWKSIVYRLEVYLVLRWTILSIVILSGNPVEILIWSQGKSFGMIKKLFTKNLVIIINR